MLSFFSCKGLLLYKDLHKILAMIDFSGSPSNMSGERNFSYNCWLRKSQWSDIIDAIVSTEVADMQLHH